MNVVCFPQDFLHMIDLHKPQWDVKGVIIQIKISDRNFERQRRSEGPHGTYFLKHCCKMQV